MKKSLLVILTSIILSSIIIPTGYGYWKKNLYITGKITVKTPIFNFKKITGGGFVGEENSRNSFGFNALPRIEGLDVNLEYNDHQNDTNLIQIKINDFATNVEEIQNQKGEVVGVEFDISCYIRPEAEKQKINSIVHVRVLDNGEPGNIDVFQLTIIEGLNKGYSSGDGKISNGNIQLH